MDIFGADSFIDTASKELRFITIHAANEGFVVMLYDHNLHILASTEIKVSTDALEDGTPRKLKPTKMRVHQNSCMKYFIVEYTTQDCLWVARFSKRDASLTSGPVLFPIREKKTMRFNDSYCALQAHREKEGPRYALLIVDFELCDGIKKGAVFRPQTSITPKTPQIGISSTLNVLYFFEKYNGGIHLSWVDPSADWESKNTMVTLYMYIPTSEAVTRHRL